MGKKHLCLSVDDALVEEAKELKINLSKAFEDYLESFIISHKEDTEGINYKLLMLEIEKTREKVFEKSKKLNKLMQKKKVYDEKLKEKEELKLKDEKEKKENLQKCVVCNAFMPNLEHNKPLGEGYVCNECYYSEDRDIKKKIVKLACGV